MDLYSPILSSHKGPAPLIIKIGVQQSDLFTEGGPVVSSVKPETYVLLSALPEELRQRVNVAVQAILSGM